MNVEPSSALPISFFQRSTRRVARELIGMHLVRQFEGQFLVATIVETEAYLPRNDSACHASTKRTPKNEPMFLPGGASYVYAIHAKYCFNVVTENEGMGCAVLIRSAMPAVGLDWMHHQRQTADVRQLLSGPGKLCQAMSIDKKLNGEFLSLEAGLWIGKPERLDPQFKSIKVTPRIGVTSAQEKKLRYVVRDSKWASGTRKLNA